MIRQVSNLKLSQRPTTKEEIMCIAQSFKLNLTVGQSQNATQRRNTTIRRIDASGANFISPIERWPDNNYAPYELDYIYTQNSESSEIVAPLHSFRPQDVHVAITRGHIIILLADDEDKAYFERQEFYCEVPLPPDMQKNDAFVEIDSHFLTIHLIKKQVFLKRAVSTALRCRNSFAFLLGKRWNLGRLDE
jgi:hypothetical protein